MLASLSMYVCVCGYFSTLDKHFPFTNDFESLNVIERATRLNTTAVTVVRSIFYSLSLSLTMHQGFIDVWCVNAFISLKFFAVTSWNKSVAFVDHFPSYSFLSLNYDRALISTFYLFTFFSWKMKNQKQFANEIKWKRAYSII